QRSDGCRRRQVAKKYVISWQTLSVSTRSLLLELFVLNIPLYQLCTVSVAGGRP
ncbi:hypothetical protein Bhyg_14559, partial [Pseudolycoriella hygida]